MDSSEYRDENLKNATAMKTNSCLLLGAIVKGNISGVDSIDRNEYHGNVTREGSVTSRINHLFRAIVRKLQIIIIVRLVVYHKISAIKSSMV